MFNVFKCSSSVGKKNEFDADASIKTSELMITSNLINTRPKFDFYNLLINNIFAFKFNLINLPNVIGLIGLLSNEDRSSLVLEF